MGAARGTGHDEAVVGAEDEGAEPRAALPEVLGAAPTSCGKGGRGPCQRSLAPRDPLGPANPPGLSLRGGGGC